MRTNVSFQINKRTIQSSKSCSLLTSKIGIWMNGRTYWLKNVTEKLFPHEAISVKISEKWIHSKIKLMDIFITNHQQKKKEIKLIVRNGFEKFAKDDLTFIAPKERVIFHIGRQQMHLVNGQSNGSIISDYTVHPIWNIYTDRFWKCQRKGLFKYQPLSHGPSDSLFALNLHIPGAKTLKANTWVISGDSKEELLQLNRAVLKNTLAFQHEK
jgi:hypothetical protein